MGATCLPNSVQWYWEEESSHEGLVSHRSIIRGRDHRDHPDLAASHAARRRAERRSGAAGTYGHYRRVNRRVYRRAYRGGYYGYGYRGPYEPIGGGGGQWYPW